MLQTVRVSSRVLYKTNHSGRRYTSSPPPLPDESSQPPSPEPLGPKSSSGLGLALVWPPESSHPPEELSPGCTPKSLPPRSPELEGGCMISDCADSPLSSRPRKRSTTRSPAAAPAPKPRPARTELSNPPPPH